MSDGSVTPVSVSRRIQAPAAELFAVLADPGRHPVIDGSGMLREAGGTALINGVGDVFSMSMHNAEMGDYEMSNLVVEYEQDRRIGWEPALRAATRPEGPRRHRRPRRAPVELRAHPGRPGRHRRHGDLRLHPLPAVAAYRGQGRPALGREHDHHAGEAGSAVRRALGGVSGAGDR